MTPASDLRPDDLRASDSEREQVAGVLRDHAAQGRLDVDELADRLERAYAARTRTELAVLTRDLPEEPSVRHRSARDKARRELREHVVAYALVNLFLIGIWAASGAGYFWPIWPLLGWGIGVAAHASETLLGVRPRGRCGRGPRVQRSRTPEAIGRPRA